MAASSVRFTLFTDSLAASTAELNFCASFAFLLSIPSNTLKMPPIIAKAAKALFIIEPSVINSPAKLATPTRIVNKVPLNIPSCKLLSLICSVASIHDPRMPIKLLLYAVLATIESFCAFNCASAAAFCTLANCPVLSIFSFIVSRFFCFTFTNSSSAAMTTFSWSRVARSSLACASSLGSFFARASSAFTLFSLAAISASLISVISFFKFCHSALRRCWPVRAVAYSCASNFSKVFSCASALRSTFASINLFSCSRAASASPALPCAALYASAAVRCKFALNCPSAGSACLINMPVTPIKPANRAPGLFANSSTIGVSTTLITFRPLVATSFKLDSSLSYGLDAASFNA